MAKEMTKEQLKQYYELDTIFIKDCTRAANILGKFERFTQKCSDINYAEKFHLDDGGNEVVWCGDEYWGHGMHEEHWDCFPVDYLTMSDEEIESVAKEENEKFLKEKQKEHEEIEEQKRKKEFQEYQKLKEKFEHMDTK